MLYFWPKKQTATAILHMTLLLTHLHCCVIIYYSNWIFFHQEQSREWPYETAATIHNVWNGANSTGVYPGRWSAIKFIMLLHIVKQLF